MTSPFTALASGGPDPRVVWRDERCIALHGLEPLRPGHCLVVPREEIDHWIDLPPDLASHVMTVARTVGRAIQAAFGPAKVGLMIAGLKVRHAHVHLIPIEQLRDLVEPGPQPVDGVAAAAAIRLELRRMEAAGVADG